MPRVIVTTNLPPSGEPYVLLDEHISTVHLASDHAAAQLIERLTWAIRDAERAELDRLATPARCETARAHSVLVPRRDLRPRPRRLAHRRRGGRLAARPRRMRAARDACRPGRHG